MNEILELCYAAAIKLNHSLQFKSIDDLCQLPFINTFATEFPYVLCM